MTFKALGLLGGLLLAVACGGKSVDAGTDGNTHWLKGCQSDADCGEELSCLCGRCTQTCETGSRCDEQSGGLAPLCAVAECGAGQDELTGVCSTACSEPGGCLGTTSDDEDDAPLMTGNTGAESSGAATGGSSSVGSSSEALNEDTAEENTVEASGSGEGSRASTDSPTGSGSQPINDSSLGALLRPADADELRQLGARGEPSPEDPAQDTAKPEAGPAAPSIDVVAAQNPDSQPSPETSGTQGGGLGAATAAASLPPVPWVLVQSNTAIPSGSTYEDVSSSWALFNLKDPSQAFRNLAAPLSSRIMGSPLREISDARPWSPNGRWLALTDGNEVTFHDLYAGTEAVARAELSGSPELVGWIDDDSALLQVTGSASNSVLQVNRDGATAVVAEIPGQPIGPSSLSPDGRWFVYATPGGSGLEMYSLDVSSGAAPQALGEVDAASIVSFKWSVDSTWIAFGTPGEQTGGTFLASPALGHAPTNVSPPGEGFYPEFGFSPDGSHFVSYFPGTLALLELGQSPSAPESIGMTPSSWSADGSFLSYSDGVSVTRRLGATSGQAEYLDVFGFSFTCDHNWLSPTELVYHACDVVNGGDNAAYWAVFGDDSVGLRPLTEEIYGLRANTECVAVWDRDRNVSTSPAGNDLSLAVAATDISRPIELHPEGLGMVWAVPSSLFRWQRFEDCAPSGEAVTFDMQSSVSGFEFLPMDL